MKSPVCLLLSAVLSVAACRTGQPANVVVVEDDAPTENALAIIDAAEDRRTLAPALAALTNQTDPGIRRQLAVAVGRIGDAKGAELLHSLLSDPDLEVRRAAYFASGLLGAATGGLRAALVSRLDEEDSAEGIAAIANALGRIGSAEDILRLGNLLDHPLPAVRASALQALCQCAVRNLPIPDSLVMNTARYLEDQADNVRLMSAFALDCIPPISNGAAIVEKLAAAAGDPAAEVRILALSALGKWGATTTITLNHALNNADMRIGAAAVRSLESVAPGARRALVLQVLEMVASRVTQDAGRMDREYGHVVWAALEAAVPFRGSSGIETQAGRIALAAEGLDKTRSAAAARILCLARLVAGRNNLALLSCDPGRPENGKQIAMLKLYRGSDTPSEHINILKQWVADTSPEVAVTAVAMLGRIDSADAKRALLESLGDKRAVVVTAALFAIAARPAHFKQISVGNGLKTTIRAIGDVVTRFQPFEHAHAPLIAAAVALRAMGSPAAEPILLQLGSDTRPAVRHAVLNTFRAIHALKPPPGFAPLTPVRPFSHEKKTSTQLRKARAVVMTSRGGFSISLSNATAPAAVDSFVELARAGFYNQTSVHRVLPGKLVQAGDRTGTGMGDAGYCLRDEPTLTPFQRGTVGMTQSVKDSSGSQFFITLSRQPALDGDYTVLGQVTSGMETVELLAQGDVIEEVIVSID